MLELTVLGLPQLRQGGTFLPVRAHRLMFLSYLALEGVVDRGTLAACFWEGLDPAVARSRLRLELHRVRQSSLGAALGMTGDSVQLSVECDAVQSRDAHAERNWDQVVAVYRGEFLASMAADTPLLQAWLESWRATFARQMDEALRQLIAAADLNGEAEKALQHEYRLLELNPYSEEICGALVTRLVQQGRPDEARRCEDRYRSRAVADLGLDQPTTMPSVRFGRQPEQREGAALKSELGEAPLVGRDTLWAQLDAWQCSLSGVLVLTGEGGVGKSRLVSEWCRRQGKRALIVQGVELGQGVPYYALGETLRQVNPAVFRALSSVWKSELAALWPDLFPESAAARSSSPIRLLEALTAVLRAAMAEKFLVLEDLHWFDAASIHVLAHAQKRWRAQGDAVYILATARPGELAEQVAALAWLAELEREGIARRTVVPPLSQVAVLSLIRQLSGSHQATGFARRLHALSGGNAYALLAFLQGLEDQGVLERPLDGTWKLTVNLGALEEYLTSTLGEALCLAIERHGAAPLRWLETASLLTPPFEFDTVWEGSGLEEGAALSVLDLALRHRWVIAAESSGYRLSHDLLRHALQTQLRPERAVRIHRKLARHFAVFGGHVAELARHLEAAGDLQAAYPQWREAARQAACHWAHSEALAFLERALACNNDLREQLEIHFQSCFHHRSLNDLPGWSNDLDKAETILASTLNDAVIQQERLRYIRQRTHLLWKSDRLEDAMTSSNDWSQGELSDERVHLLHDRGVILRLLGQPEKSLKLLLSTLGSLGSERISLAANIHNALALSAYDAGFEDIALEHSDQAINLFKDIDYVEGLASATGNQAMLHGALGNTTLQISALKEAISYANLAGSLTLQKTCLKAICTACEDIKDWRDGLNFATQGLEVCENMVDDAGCGIFGAWISSFRVIRSKEGMYS